MKMSQLNRWHDWWYLPTMSSLYVFDATTGIRVSMWYVSGPYEWKRWYFGCHDNKLPDDKRLEFESVVKQWKTHVDKKLCDSISND